jgi:hypothetical protein
VTKRELIEDLTNSLQNSSDDLESEGEEDLESSIWMPVIIDSKNNDKAYRLDILSDPNIREMDLAEISEKEVFVRKADLVRKLHKFFH